MKEERDPCAIITYCVPKWEESRGGQEGKDFSSGGKEKTKRGEKERRGRTTIPPISATNRHKKDRRRTVLVPKVSFDVLRPFTVHVQARSIEEERKETKRKKCYYRSGSLAFYVSPPHTCTKVAVLSSSHCIHALLPTIISHVPPKSSSKELWQIEECHVLNVDLWNRKIVMSCA